jgi:hypothetical protein
MNGPPVLYQMKDWGYHLLPKFHSYSPGHTGLLVAIREAPTKMHFDPESIRLQLRGRDGIASWTTLKLKAPFQETKHVCPGRVILSDRTDKRVYFFVFGGSLEATFGPGETVYTLRSPAPILELTEPEDSIPDQLASETEAMMGQVQARWGSNDAGFARRLAQVDPFQFYLASLHSILLRCRQSRALQECLEDLYDVLLREQDWLMRAGQWSASLPTLEVLLAPDPNTASAVIERKDGA